MSSERVTCAACGCRVTYDDYCDNCHFCGAPVCAKCTHEGGMICGMCYWAGKAPEPNRVPESNEPPQIELALPGAPGFSEHLKSCSAGKWTMAGPCPGPSFNEVVGLPDSQIWIVRLDGVKLGEYETCGHSSDGKHICSYVGKIPGYVDQDAVEYLRRNPTSSRRPDEVWLLYSDRFYDSSRQLVRRPWTNLSTAAQPPCPGGWIPPIPFP